MINSGGGRFIFKIRVTIGVIRVIIRGNNGNIGVIKLA